MKIDKGNSRPGTVQLKSDSSVKKIVVSETASFQSALGKEADRMEIDRLMYAISEAGERLKKKLDLIELRKYQGQVKKFLQHVLGGTFAMNEQVFRDNRGRQKTMTLIKLVDQDLNELTEMVMNGEKDRLEILNKIDRIKGMLIDMTM